MTCMSVIPAAHNPKTTEKNPVHRKTRAHNVTKLRPFNCIIHLQQPHLSHAVIQPHAVVVHKTDAAVAVSAMLRSVILKDVTSEAYAGWIHTGPDM